MRPLQPTAPGGTGPAGGDGKLPKSTAYKPAQEGNIPGQKGGRYWQFRKEAIDT